jgi:hypothetical protein
MKHKINNVTKHMVFCGEREREKKEIAQHDLKNSLGIFAK